MEEGAHGDYRTAGLRHQCSPISVDVGPQKRRPERRDEDNGLYSDGESHFLDAQPEGNVGSGRGMGIAMEKTSFRPRFPQPSGKSRGFPKFQKEFVNFAKTYGYSNAILGGLYVPVRNQTRKLSSLLHEGYTSVGYDR